MKAASSINRPSARATIERACELLKEASELLIDRAGTHERIVKLLIDEFVTDPFRERTLTSAKLAALMCESRLLGAQVTELDTRHIETRRALDVVTTQQRTVDDECERILNGMDTVETGGAAWSS